MADGRVEEIYRQLKQMAIAFRLRPGDRLNEVALSRELGVSRTPLREALNRLVAERLVEFRPGAGFFCRDLDPQEIFDLFEMRCVLESAAVVLACERADDAGLDALESELYETGLDVSGLTIAEACARDEAFHTGICKLAGNRVMTCQLERINERIRYVRWVSLSNSRLRRSKEEHIHIMQVLRARDADRAAELVRRHIEKRMDQVTDVVREGISNIYMNSAAELSAQLLVEEGA